VSADVRGLPARGLRLPWLGAVMAAEVVLVVGLVAVQRQLLAAAGARLSARAVAMVLFASTGLAGQLPAGPATAAAWQAGQYRRLGAGGTAAVWAVLAGRLASGVTTVAVLVAGAATVGVGRWWLLPAAMALAAGTAAVLAAARRAAAAAQRLARRVGRSRWRVAADLAELARHRVGLRPGLAVLAASGMSVLGEAGLLAAAFEVASRPVTSLGTQARPLSAGPGEGDHHVRAPR
jgi:uncharacterized membrane protein YbhN (UPF0104 family)